MHDFFALQTKAMRLWFDTVDANRNAMTTIALRLPMITAHSIGGRAHDGEMHRMVSEKVDAMIEGVREGAIAGGRLAGRAMLGQLNAASLAQGMVGIADASQRPARRKVRANARRLAR